MHNRPPRFASPADALRALFSAWPADRGQGTGVAEAYIIAIERFSLAAIEAAVLRLIRGEVEDIDKRFLPTPAQLGNLCAYLEKLYAPVKRPRALPAPEDIRDDSPEGIEHRRVFAERMLARFNRDDKAPVAVIEDYDAWEKRTMAECKAQTFRLSPGAMAILDRKRGEAA